MSASENRPRDRVPLRLRMAPPPVPQELDGGWWPQSRDLASELADLVGHLPTELGGVSRASIAPDDWDDAPSRVVVAGGRVKIGALSRHERHVIELRATAHRRLRLLVVPAALTTGQGEEALLAAATAGHAYSASSILEVVEEFDDGEADAFDQWVDDGEPWWGTDVAPSYRNDD